MVTHLKLECTETVLHNSCHFLLLSLSQDIPVKNLHLSTCLETILLVVQSCKIVGILFLTLVSFHCTWHSYTLLSYDLVTLKHSVLPCLRKVVWIRDFICLNLICINHFKIIFHEQKNLHSVSSFVCAHYLAAHTSSSHLIELKQWLPCLFFTKKTNPISLSKSVVSLYESACSNRGINQTTYNYYSKYM